MLLSLLRKADAEKRKPGEDSPIDYFAAGAMITLVITVVGLVSGILLVGLAAIIATGSRSTTIAWSPSYLMILPVFSVLVSALVLSFTRLRQSPKAFLPAIIGSTIVSIFIADTQSLTTSKSLLTHIFPPLLPLFFIIIAAEEALFWVDGEKLPPGRSVISFTIQKKLEAFLDVGIGVLAYIYGAVTGYFVIKTNVLAQITQIGEFALVPIGIVILAVAFIYGNSLKYRRRE
jgi:hypothetical protein